MELYNLPPPHHHTTFDTDTGKGIVICGSLHINPGDHKFSIIEQILVDKGKYILDYTLPPGLAFWSDEAPPWVYKYGYN